MKIIYNKIIFFCLFSFFLYSANCFAQITYENKIIWPTIHSLELTPENWPLSYPIIHLNSDEKLKLSFDDLDSTQTVKHFSYTLIHCTQNWQPSDLLKMDYIEGFEDQQINNHEFSQNTFCKYINYSVIFPNDDIKITKSGNYALVVLNSDNTEDTVLINRFWVSEKNALINGSVKRASIPAESNLSQEVDFEVNYFENQDKIYPDKISTVLIQNERFDISVTFSSPKYLNQNKLIYDFEDANIFKGGNEFKYFDIKNVRFKADRTDSIYFSANRYHFVLYPDNNQYRHIYSYHQDLNGRRLIKLENNDFSSIEADYILVHFKLFVPKFITDKQVYIAGALTNWQYTNLNEMKYNSLTKCYELNLLLKQGYYNYQYLVYNPISKQLDAASTEGNFVETENNYLILVYFNDLKKRYHRILAYKIINSLNR